MQASLARANRDGHAREPRLDDGCTVHLLIRPGGAGAAGSLGRVKKGLFTSLAVALILAVCAPAAHAGLSWNTTAYDFGEQDVGVSSAPVTFTLTATCDAETAGACTTPPLGAHNYGSVSAPGADFNVDSTTCDGLPLLTPTLATADSCTARVAFKPSSAGAKSGVLQTGSGQTVALAGTGVFPRQGKNEGAGGQNKCKKNGKKKKGKSSASAAKKKKGCRKKKKKK